MDLEMVALNEISQVYRKKMFSDLTHTMNFQLTNFAEVERMLLIYRMGQVFTKWL